MKVPMSGCGVGGLFPWPRRNTQVIFQILKACPVMMNHSGLPPATHPSIFPLNKNKKKWGRGKFHSFDTHADFGGSGQPETLLGQCTP